MQVRVSKKQVIQLLKITIALGLIYYLVVTGRLDFGQMRVIVARPGLFAITVAGWFLTSVCLGSLRWWILLRGMRLFAPYLRALQLQMIGLFFNATMPGSVGGDIVKGFYIIKDQHQGDKTPAMLTVLFDRIVGLMALFFMGAAVLVFNAEVSLDNPALQTVTFLTYLGAFLSLVFILIIVLPLSFIDKIVSQLLNLRLPGYLS